jgi:hypothetical protein
MSQQDFPAETEAKQILQGIEDIKARQDLHSTAINNLGSNLQWMIEQAAPLLEMFNSPMFSQMMPGMMAGAMGGLPDGGED